jgi:hypothetical protein
MIGPITTTTIKNGHPHLPVRVSLKNNKFLALESTKTSFER